MFFLELTIAKAGILDPVVKLMGKIFNLIFEVLMKIGIENTALCIVIFTIIVRALMIPLNIKQQRFTKLQGRMNPEIMAIQTKYKGKRDEDSLRKQNSEMHAVYEKYGASPTSGCLPLLITFPIIIGLYRVIYNIPGHITYIGDLYDKIANAISGVKDYDTVFEDFITGLNSSAKYKSGSGVDGIKTALNSLNTTQWSELADTFSSVKATIEENSAEIIRVNRFLFGLNITNTPVLDPFPGVIIPILAVVTQWYQTRQVQLSSGSDKDKKNQDNPTMQSMMMMTKIMPFVSGFMCLMLPIGVGIYWVTGSVFMICQQYFTNRYLNKIDVDELIAKNTEKANKRRERLGLDKRTETDDISKTSSLSETAKYNTKKSSSNNYNYKKGSVGDYANLLNPNRKNESGDN